MIFELAILPGRAGNEAGEKSDIHIGSDQTKLIGSQDGGIIGQDVAAGGGALAKTEIIAASQLPLTCTVCVAGLKVPS